MPRRFPLVAAILIAAVSQPALADDVRWGVGLGVEFGPDFPGSGDSSASPSPMIERLEGDEVFYADLQAGPRIGLYDAGSVELGLGIDFRGGRDREDLPTSLRGLDEIDLAIEIGGYAAWNLQPFQLRLDVLADVTDEHGGIVATPAIEWYSNPDSNIRTNFSIGADWTSGDYQSTYFGITRTQAMATGLPVFDADAGFSRAFIQTGLAYDINQNWALSAVLGWSRWIGDASDSPITRIGDEDFVTAEVGVIYFW